jgi:hypothetical protein
MAVTTLVLLEIRDNDEDRSWWEALGLPAPERWGVDLPDDVCASVQFVREDV